MWLWPASSFKCKLHGGTDCVCSLSHLQHQAYCLGDARSTETRPHSGFTLTLTPGHTVTEYNSLSSFSLLAMKFYMWFNKCSKQFHGTCFSLKGADVFYCHDLALLLLPLVCCVLPLYLAMSRNHLLAKSFMISTSIFLHPQHVSSNLDFPCTDLVPFKDRSTNRHTWVHCIIIRYDFLVTYILSDSRIRAWLIVASLETDTVPEI